MSITTTKDVIFDSENGLSLDIYEPDGGEVSKRAAIILVHGGGWFGGDKSADADIATWFAENGYLVAVPNYRLNDVAKFPAAYNDVFSAYEWLQASDLAFDHERIGAYGYSVGGTMAVELANKFGIPTASVSGIFNIDGWMHAHGKTKPMAPPEIKAATPERFGDAGPIGPVNEFFVWFVTSFFDQDDPHLTDRYKEGSPLHHVSVKSGPMFLANALNELVPAKEALDFSAALVQAGVPVTTRFVDENHHAKAYWREVQDDVLAFFARYLQA
ncbi:MAG: alpha/beta hydrolase [Mobiluncus sp.]|uniref:alpha/beta hydrolase n=1 Tax=Mobiluncus sp. TaxID=47293 RepID=UPI002583D38D|nr:alpha/beta hydrolase [Mobiluncus sp.]MCI6584180.1 alpha/beta hydrolase [Mobiluncus sp.]